MPIAEIVAECANVLADCLHSQRGGIAFVEISDEVLFIRWGPRKRQVDEV